MKISKSLLRFLLIPALPLAMVSAEAATQGYWRFEDSPGFLLDSSVNGLTLSTAGTAPVQTAIPLTGNGSAFPTVIPQTGSANAKFADNGGANGHFFVADPFTVTNFTLEAVLNREVQSTSTQYILSQWTGLGNQRSYAFGVSGSNGVGGGPANELFLLLSQAGSTTSVFGSGLILGLNTDYYAGVSFDLGNTASGIKFYSQNLTSGGALQTASVGHSLTALNDSTTLLRIGGFDANDTNRFNGLLDEVRISDSVLGTSDLLVTAVPEPNTTFAVLLGGVVMLLVYRRRSRQA